MGYVKCRKCGSTRWKRVLTNTEIAECSVFNYEKEGLGLEDRNIDVKQKAAPDFLASAAFKLLRVVAVEGHLRHHFPSE
jgi:hypothetical protein